KNVFSCAKSSERKIRKGLVSGNGGAHTVRGRAIARTVVSAVAGSTCAASTNDDRAGAEVAQRTIQARQVRSLRARLDALSLGLCLRKQKRSIERIAAECRIDGMINQFRREGGRRCNNDKCRDRRKGPVIVTHYAYLE